jgi:hypothetical protein
LNARYQDMATEVVIPVPTAHEEAARPENIFMYGDWTQWSEVGCTRLEPEGIGRSRADGKRGPSNISSKWMSFEHRFAGYFEPINSKISVARSDAIDTTLKSSETSHAISRFVKRIYQQSGQIRYKSQYSTSGCYNISFSHGGSPHSPSVARD